MNKLYYASLIALLCWMSPEISTRSEQQIVFSPATTDTLPVSHFCHQEKAWQQALKERPTLKNQQIRWERGRYQRANQATLSSRASGPPYELPVVVHIIHNNGSENISDAQVLSGIQHLNEAFGNRAYYNQGTGVNTQIQFCLAQQDPNGNTSTGINRVVAPLTNMTSETDDLALKNLSRWDPNHYINIWLVKEICSLSSGCGVAGYAYFPSAHGSDIDGMVVEARYFGPDEGSSGVQVHEMGHYLGLYHTFQGGCTNNDCLSDGDRVCDTPPDQSRAAVRCGDPMNSCMTDVNAADPNNPFTSDQGDMYINYMDYGDFDCYSAFTQGQTDRMYDAIDNVRASLLDSEGCEVACMSPLTAGFIVADDTILIGTTLSFVNTSVGATNFDWTIDGVAFPGGTYTFNNLGTFDIELTAMNSDPNCTDKFVLRITVICGAKAAFTADEIHIEVGDTIRFTNTSMAATIYRWTVDAGSPTSTTNFIFTSITPGIYEICLTASDGLCQSEVCQLVVVREPVDCASSSFQEYITPANDRVHETQLITDGVDPILSFTITRPANNGIFGLSRLNNDGAVSWMKSYEFNGRSSTNDIIGTSDGGFAVIGGGLGRCFLLKTDRDGNALWSREYEELSENIGASILETTDGGMVILGTTGNSGNGAQGQLIKIDKDGNVEWNTRIEYRPNPPRFDPINLTEVILTPDNGYMLAGRISHTASFQGELLLIKVDQNGTVEWGRKYDKLVQRGMTIMLNDSNTGYYIANNLSSALDGKFGITELDLNGEIVRHQSFDKPGIDHASHMELLSNGQILISGVTSDNSSSFRDYLFLLLLDKQWNVVVAQAYKEGLNRIFNLSIGGKSHVTSQNEIFLAAVYSNFNGQRDVFLTKTSQTFDASCPTSPVIFNVAPSPISSATVTFNINNNQARSLSTGVLVNDLTPQKVDLCRPACEACDNGIDDDGDGLVDFFDPDCPCVDTIGCNTPFFSPCFDNCGPSIDLSNLAMSGTQTTTNINETSILVAGDIDGDCQTDIVALEFGGRLVVIDGITLRVKYREGNTSFNGNFCVGDVDDDGQAEIFLLGPTGGPNEYHISRIDYNSSTNRLDKTWSTDQDILYLSTDGLRGHLFPFLADFNQDGRAEVYIGNQIFDSQTGRELAKGGLALNRGGARVPFPGSTTRVRGIQSSAIAVDMLAAGDCMNCEGLELVAGNQVMAVDIQSYTNPALNSVTVVAELAGMDDGTTSVVDFDLDGDLDVVVADYNNGAGSLNRVYVWDVRTNALIGNPIVVGRSPGISRVSIPAVGDMDGDGYPEIAINNSRLYIFEDYITGGQTAWGVDASRTIKAQTESGDHALGFTLFDFNLDGQQELVIRNNDGLAIYDGNLTKYASDPFYAFTQDDYALIVDIDNDDEAEIVTYGCIGASGGNCHTLMVYESTGFTWPNTRKVWNQYAAFNVNIHDDGSIPAEQQQQHLTASRSQLNSYNQQYAIPNATTPEARISNLLAACSSAGSELSFELCNEGNAPLPIGTPIAIYEGNPTRINAPLLLQLSLLSPLAPDSCMDFTQIVSSTDSIFVVANDDGSLPRPYSLQTQFPITPTYECNYLNNIDGNQSPANNPPLLNLGPDQIICDNGVFPLDASPRFASYLWFDGSTASTTTVYDPGTYWVEATDSCGTIQTDTIEIIVDPLTAVELGPDLSACFGDTLLLDAGNFDHYRWRPSIGLACDTCRSLRLLATRDTQIIVTAWSDLGCYTTDTLNISLQASSITTDTQYLCAGDTFIVSTHIITTDTLLTQSFPSPNFCDSINTTQIIILDTFFTMEQLQLCKGDTAIVFGTEVTQDEVLFETTPSINGCDSTHQITVSFSDTVFTMEQLQYCEGDTVIVFGTEVTQDEVLFETTPSINGCDSTHQITVSFSDTIFTMEQLQYCEGDTVIVFGTEVTQDEVLFETTPSINGCDSTHQITVSFSDTIFTMEQLQFCEGDTVMVFGTEVTQDDVLLETTPSINGCDSTHQITVSFSDTIFTMEQLQFCEGDTVIVFDTEVTQDEVLFETTPSSNGCDSTHQITVSFSDTVFTMEQLQFCEGDTVIVFGTEVTQDEVLFGTTPSINGCDSTHQITVSFSDTIFTMEQLQFCEGDTGIVFGIEVTQDEVLFETTPSINGCDSTHQITVSFSDTIFTMEQLQFCEGDTVMVFGTEVTQDEVLFETTPSINGCDSTHQITVSFSDTIFTMEQLQYCEGDTVIVFGSVVTQDDVLSETFLSLSGCDSIHQVMVNFDDTIFTTEQISICAGDTAYVFGIAVTEQGLLAQTFSAQNGCDSTHEVMVDFLEEVMVNLADTICNGDYLLFFNDTIRQSGIYMETESPLSGGCATTYILSAEVIPDIYFKLPQDTTIRRNQAFTIPLLFTDSALLFSWSPADQVSCSGCPNPTVSLNTDVLFELMISNAWGCSDTASIFIRVEDLNSVFIPNVFTPNGDQINDHFVIFSDANVEEIVQLQIFDRWGGLLYEEKNSRPNEPNLGWDGTSNGELLNPGVYVYQVWLKMKNGEMAYFAGDVALIR